MHPDWLVPEWRAGGVSALMTTRRGGFSAAPFDSMNLRAGLGDDAVSVQRNRALFERVIGATPVMLNQVHGARVVRLHRDDAKPGAAVHEADASVTTERGIACAVQVADCLPVLLAAPGGVAAAHAGWRGLSAGVIEATVAALCEARGCAPDEIEAWLGACIGPDRFEVGADVLHAFGASPEAAAPRFRPHTPGKWLADLPGLARDRLQGSGVRTIGGGRWCTVEDTSRFFSFRRDGVTGRMLAAVWLRG
ncbi:peptidoglycan editing factor PgeF [Piscinibacter sp. XHJ-5]|uniref:peptidoglycan editing factor PgeF n=1 Tax=Piscinibacter sp. XHJ-5 TaxID=3037797 RepID=UPI002452AC45|nr:peptidoglycan editing factor PgeF [Piscinibacter sp. XHJ-5]